MWTGVEHFELSYQLNGSVKEPNKFHNYDTEKITPKASYVAEYIELFGSSTRDRHAQHDAFSVILWTSTNICVVVHDTLGWRNPTTLYNCMFLAMICIQLSNSLHFKFCWLLYV